MTVWLRNKKTSRYHYVIVAYVALILNINSRVQALPISAHEMAPMRAFSILQKWSKIAKMTPDDLLSLTIVSSEPLGNTEQNTLLVF